MLSFLTATEFSKKKRRPSDTFFAYDARVKKDIKRRLKHQGWISLSMVTRTTGSNLLSKTIKEVVNLRWYDCYLDIMVLTYLRGITVIFAKKDQVVCLKDILVSAGVAPSLTWLFEESTRQQFLKGMECSVSKDKKSDIKDQTEDLLEEVAAAGLF